MAERNLKEKIPFVLLTKAAASPCISEFTLFVEL